jgi:excisionase family DNA binding protein
MGDRLAMGLKEAGAAIGLSPWTIRKYVAEGKIAAIRIGRRVLIEPSELRRFVKAAKMYCTRDV